MLQRSELPVGALVDNDRYQIVGVLGRGAFGTTYEATDVKLGRSVALKELLPTAGDRARSRFLEEACALARFTHPGIVRVHDVFEDAGAAYVVMELVRGRSLAALVEERQGGLPIAEAVDLVRRAGEALAVVHAAGMLHRDVKPENIVAADDGRVVLLDFGAARDFVAGEQGTMTQVLTPGYAPVEQYASSGQFGPATDIYALGATAYHLLSGERPPSSPDRLQGLAVRPLHNVDPAVPRQVGEAVAWALELRADARPGTVQQFLDALAVGHGPPDATRVITPTQVVEDDVRVSEVFDDDDDDGWDDTAAVDVVPAEDSEPAVHVPRRRVVLPVALGLGALTTVAPVAVAIGWVLLVLPLVNAFSATGQAVRMRRELRGRRWWDGVGAPFAFLIRWLWSLVVAVIRTAVVLFVLAVFAAVGIVTADLETETIGTALRSPPGRVGLALLGAGLALVVPTLLRSSDAYVNHLPRLVRVPDRYRMAAWALALVLVLLAVVSPLTLVPIDRWVHGL